MALDPHPALLNSALIVGAGPVGAVAALALAANGVAVRVVESLPRNATRDTRTLALSYGSRLILERVGVWQRLATATPILDIHISQRGAFGVAKLSARELDVPALGYVMPYADLTAALQTALDDAGIAVHYDAPATALATDADCAHLTLEDGTCLDAALIVIADGGRNAAMFNSKITPEPKIARDYGQSAVVCEVETELPHANLAFERFTADGPAALLPKGSRYSMVWTANEADAERIAALPDPEFLAALQVHFGSRRGRFLSATPRKRFPLRLAYTGTQADARVVRIGNAAQTLHPVAGQGFNIGLRDAWELADSCADAPDIGAKNVLASYARGRRFDVAGGLGFTDFLVRVFASDLLPLRHARAAGLVALEMLPGLKRFVGRRMMFGANG